MKIITAIFAIFIATSAHAETLQIVNPGSEEGAFRQVLSTIGENYEHNFIQANNPVTAYTHLNNENVLTVWSSEWPGDPELQSPEITESNVVALMSYETLMCSREFTSLDEMSGKTVKVATWGSDPVAKFLNEFGKTHNIDFIVVPFDGSGSTVRGYIGQDASTIFTISSKQNSILEDSNTTCFAFSEKNDINFRFIDAIVTINGSQELTSNLQKLVLELSQTQEWKDTFEGTKTYVGEEHFPMFVEAVKNFSK